MIISNNNNASDDTNQVAGTSTDVVGWGGWAWDMVSSVLPVDWDNDWSAEQQMSYSGHTIHLGVYIDDATLTFKVWHDTFNILTLNYLRMSNYILSVSADC